MQQLYNPRYLYLNGAFVSGHGIIPLHSLATGAAWFSSREPSTYITIVFKAYCAGFPATARFWNGATMRCINFPIVSHRKTYTTRLFSLLPK